MTDFEKARDEQFAADCDVTSDDWEAGANWARDYFAGELAAKRQENAELKVRCRALTVALLDLNRKTIADGHHIIKDALDDYGMKEGEA